MSTTAIRVFALSSSVLALALTGCGMGVLDSPTAAPAEAVSYGGTLHGGPNPVVGATVKLYSTGSTGYGAGATLLATTTTDSNGYFNFPANTCVAGSQVYATAAGGNTGANTPNPNSLLVAAVGPCSSVNSSTQIWINELSTVAAAYALGNFATVSGSGATAAVNIGAPAANNAVLPLCSGTGTAMACTAAGLRHAFTNALNLVHSSSVLGGAPNGSVYSAPPSNANGVIPAALINTLGNVLQTCVNSTGGAAGSTTGCGKLFTDTTPPTTSTASPVTPTNTFQAMLNLAKYPSMTPGQVSALFGLASATSYYLPQLTAAPLDWTVAISYKGVTSGATTVPFNYPFYLTLDYADNVYAATQPSATSGPVIVTGMGSDGTSLFAGTPISTANCLVGAGCIMAAGVDGHLWLPVTNTNTPYVYEIDSASGSLVTYYNLGAQTAPYAASVDRFNNVFISSYNTTYPNIFTSSTNSTGITFAPAQDLGQPVQETIGVPGPMAFDQNGSLWNVNITQSGSYSSYLANSGTTSTVFNQPLVTTTESTTAGPAYSVLVDASGNGWVNNLKTLFKVAPGATAPTLSVTVQSPYGDVPNAIAQPAIDGAGNIFLPDNSDEDSRLWEYFPGTGKFALFAPCYIPSGQTTCGGGQYMGVFNPHNIRIDSTGSMWVSSANNGSILQVLGTAAPAWPQASLAKPGVMPQ